MFDSVRNRRKNKAQAEIRMAPLIDMVFILLIFFLVTTSFVAETGITVERPQARSSEVLDKESLMVGIGPTGQVYVEGRRVSMFSVRSLVRNKVNVRPGLGVVLVADKVTPADYVVRAMDEIQLGGVERVALAARQESQ